MSGRSAPASGYDFGNKRRYRRDIWGAFSEHLQQSQDEALLMPSLEGDEIAIAESRGFDRHRLHCVDRNPAIVASLQRRYPGIQTYGVELGRACERIADKEVKLKAANLDFTSCVSEGLLDSIERVAEADVMADKSLVAVTVLRGREKRDTTENLEAIERSLVAGGGNLPVDAACVTPRRPTGRDAARIYLVMLAFWAAGYAFTIERCGIYLSGKQTMLWWMSGLIREAEAARRYSELDRELRQDYPLPDVDGDREAARREHRRKLSLVTDQRFSELDGLANVLVMSDNVRAAYGRDRLYPELLQAKIEVERLHNEGWGAP